MSSKDTVRRHTRTLDVVPSFENQSQEGTSMSTSSQDRQEGFATLNAPIDLEEYDDDVVISSPRAFAEAKNNSRRNQRQTVVVDVESEEEGAPKSHQRSHLRSQMNVNSGIYMNPEDSSHFMPKQRWSVPLPSLPKEPTFNCPICMGPFVEEMSTKCGHIFCKVCISTAIAALNKCPTCRQKITSKNIFRIYLPTATALELPPN